LQHAAVDEFDGATLDDLHTARFLHVDELPAIDDLQKLEGEKRVVEVLAQVLEAKNRLVLDQPGAVQIGAFRRQGRNLLKQTSPQPPGVGEKAWSFSRRHKVAFG